MKLYGHAISLMTWQVLLTLMEKNLRAEAVSVDVLSLEQRQQEHLRRHPFGHIPVLEDDGFWLYETDAILRYLDERDGTPTLSQHSVRSRAQQNQWLCVLDTYLYTAVKKATARDYAKMMGDADPGAAIAEEGERDLAQALSVFRTHMAGRVHVADDYGLADIRWATFLEDLSRMMPDRVADTLGDLSGWLDPIRQRPAWRKSLEEREAFGR